MRGKTLGKVPIVVLALERSAVLVGIVLRLLPIPDPLRAALSDPPSPTLQRSAKNRFLPCKHLLDGPST